MVKLETEFNCGTNADIYVYDKPSADFDSNLKLKFDAIIMKKKREIINTLGTQCFAKKITGYSYFNFFKSRENLIETIKLSYYECKDMITSKKCYGNKMTCEGETCFYKPKDIYYDYSFLSTTRKESFECVTIDRLVISYNEDTNIFNSLINSCKASDGLCFLHDSTIIWNINGINTCPYQTLFYAYGFDITNNVAISKSEEILFRLDSTQVKCNGDMRIHHTTSGLGLVFVPALKNESNNYVKVSQYRHTVRDNIKTLKHYSFEKKTQRNLKKMEISNLSYLSSNHKSRILQSMVASEEQLEIVIAEEDYAKYYNNIHVAGLYNREEIKLCNLFKNQLDSFRALNNMFFEINLLDSSPLNIYVKDGIIYLPKCLKVNKIVVPEQSKYCFEDIPINMISEDGLLNTNRKNNSMTNNTRTIEAFMSKDGFLRPVSKRVACGSANQIISVAGLNLRIEQKETNYLIHHNDKVATQSFHPDNINISNINFNHHMEKIAGSDIIDTIKELNKVTDVNGDFYILPSQSIDQETAVNHLLNSITEYKDNYKGLFWFMVVLILIIISCILEKVTGIWTFFYTIIKNSLELCGICCKTGKACCGADLV
jgi:hypothetical protein